MPYVRTRLGRLYFEERSAARRPRDPVMVLMSSVLFDGRMWKRQVEPLSALGRVVVLDGPGHGRSEAPPRFSLEDQADSLLDVFAELAIERAVLIGLSWGGMVGMRAALQHAERVAALVLIDTSADAEPTPNRVRYRLLAAFARRFGLSPQMTDREAAPKFFSAGFRNEHPEAVEGFMRAARGFDREGLARAALAVLVKRTSVVDKLSRIHQPTLVMCGSADNATPLAQSETIAQRIPGAKLVVLEGAGHISVVEQPERANDAMVSFLRATVYA